MGKILTPDNKKQEILDYINENTSTDDPFKISRKSLISKFKDDNYDEAKIDDLIDDCIHNDESIGEGSINIEIVYPISKEKEIKSKWKDFILPYKTGTILFLLYIAEIVATYYTNQKYMAAALLIPIGMLMGYGVLKFTFDFTLRNIPLFKNFNYKLISCYLFTLLIIGLLTYGYSYVKKENFTTGYLLTIIIGSGAIGTLVYKFVLNKD